MVQQWLCNDNRPKTYKYGGSSVVWVLRFLIISYHNAPFLTVSFSKLFFFQCMHQIYSSDVSSITSKSSIAKAEIITMEEEQQRRENSIWIWFLRNFYSFRIVLYLVPQSESSNLDCLAWSVGRCDGWNCVRNSVPKLDRRHDVLYLQWICNSGSPSSPGL